MKTIDTLVKAFYKKALKEDNRERAHFKNGAEGIFLRVYDVVRFNRVLEYLGIGFYHTAIQIYGHEYYYGGHDAEITGVVETDIGKSTSLHLKEVLLVGYTYYDADDVDLLLDEFGKFWQGIGYDPFSHNCNDFTRAFIKHISHEEGLFEYPNYVNRFSKLSSLLRVWFQPLKNLFGDVVNAPEDEVMGHNENAQEGEGDEQQNDLENQIQEPDDQYYQILDDAKTESDRADAFYISGFYEKAEYSYLQTLDMIEKYSSNIFEIHNLRITTFFNLAMVAQKLNKITDLVNYCTECISLDCENPKYFLKRAQAVAYHQGNYRAALADLQKAHELDDRDPVVIEELKKINERMNRDEDVEVKEL